jgi:DNA-binding transcriptional ArsR family regulator
MVGLDTRRAALRGDLKEPCRSLVDALYRSETLFQKGDEAMAERRPVLTDPEVLEALAHPVRLDLLSYLMSNGPATASACARAVGDTPSNCSYHLRTLARHELVEPVASADRRQRPWRATITGFALDQDADPSTRSGRGAAAVMAASVALQQRLLRDYLSQRDSVAAAWREVDLASQYTLRITPGELRELGEQLDALIRPLIAAGRRSAPADAELVEVDLFAFPRTEAPWRRAQP